MLLQKLVDYSHRLNLPPTLYSELAVHYIIELNNEGKFLGLIDRSEPSSPRSRRGLPMMVPEIRRTSGVRALLLCDKADYVLCYEDSAGLRQAAFLDLLRRCAAVTEEPAVAAVLRFLESSPLDSLTLPNDFQPADRITFRVEGVYPVDLPSVQEFWAAENNGQAADATVVMQCVVCGQRKPVLARLQGTIKRVPGGQTSGTSIVSANAEAFESYGLEASLIAPTCADCGERFTKAANELLDKNVNRRFLAGSAYLCWTREDVGFNFFGLLTDPPADFAALLDLLFASGSVPETDETALYATVLTGSGGRTVVREWIDSTVGEAKEHLQQWFKRQAVVDAYGEAPRLLGTTALAGATVRELRDLPRPTAHVLLRGALTGAPLPLDLLYEAVRRNRAEQTVTRPRAALIKLVLCSQQPGDPMEETMVQLDPDIDNAGYRCGRLLAVLEQAQRLAIPGVNATIVDRFFGTASSSPASIFPRLVRGAQPHLAKLERDRRGAYIALNRRIEEILAGLPVRREGALYTGFPASLTLRDQGLFSLGYYHQRAFDRTQAREAAERRRAGAASEPDADLEVGDSSDDR